MPSLPSVPRRRLRWAVPVAAAVALASAGPLLTSLQASARGSLPPRTAAQLLVDVQKAKVHALSGTVVETVDLGLPSLPSVAGHGADSSFTSLVSGSHTMRVWYAGPDRLRLALLGQLGESDLVKNGGDVWAWSSSTNTATHWTVPTQAPAGPTALPSAGTATTPQQAADAALAAIGPTTRVATDPTAVVAGRPAYQLSLVPRDPRSLVGSVRIAIDGTSHLPTRVQVFARGASSPAFEVGFTSFSTAAPADSVFSFTPPPGATVKQGTIPQHDAAPRRGHPTGAAPDVVGKGWTSVLVARVGSATATGSGSGSTRTGLDTVLRSLPRVSGSWGAGRLLRGPLFSVVLTDDGRVAVGAVAPPLLYAALAR
jgi:outer membrane lipoprotein-sorting protein